MLKLLRSAKSGEQLNCNLNKSLGTADLSAYRNVQRINSSHVWKLKDAAVALRVCLMQRKSK